MNTVAVYACCNTVPTDALSSNEGPNEGLLLCQVSNQVQRSRTSPEQREGFSGEQSSVQAGISIIQATQHASLTASAVALLVREESHAELTWFRMRVSRASMIVAS